MCKNYSLYQSANSERSSHAPCGWLVVSVSAAFTYVLLFWTKEIFLKNQHKVVNYPNFHSDCWFSFNEVSWHLFHCFFFLPFTESFEPLLFGFWCHLHTKVDQAPERSTRVRSHYCLWDRDVHQSSICTVWKIHWFAR